MAFDDPLQWIVIGAVVIVIFLWGPQKIPELARGLGRTKGEFEMASKEFRNPTLSPVQPSTAATSTKTSEEMLFDVARQLGITTSGRTTEQIAQEIVWKTKGA
jgi:sec-independent protein translocase protein TatA